MAKKRERSPSGSAPWTAKQKDQMERQPSNRPFIYLLVDQDGAELIAEGRVPEYVIEQAEGALAWCREDEESLPDLSRRKAAITKDPLLDGGPRGAGRREP